MTAEAAVQTNPGSTEIQSIPRWKGHWFWGGLMIMAGDRSGFLLDGHEEYGDVFVTRALVRDLNFVRDPAVVNAINVTHWTLGTARVEAVAWVRSSLRR